MMNANSWLISNSGNIKNVSIKELEDIAYPGCVRIDITQNVVEAM